MAKKKSKVVEVQSDGTEVYGFDSDEKLPEQEKPARVLPQDDIKDHAKFHKYKGREINGNE